MHTTLLLIFIIILIYYFTKTTEHYTDCSKEKSHLLYNQNRDCSKQSIDSSFYNYNTNIINKHMRV